MREGGGAGEAHTRHTPVTSSSATSVTSPCFPSSFLAELICLPVSGINKLPAISLPITAVSHVAV